MKRYKLTFRYNNIYYEFNISSDVVHRDLNIEDATIIVEGIIEQKIKYVKGEHVKELSIVPIE